MCATETRPLLTRIGGTFCAHGGGSNNADAAMREVATSEESKSLKLRIWLIVDSGCAFSAADSKAQNIFPLANFVCIFRGVGGGGAGVAGL